MIFRKFADLMQNKLSRDIGWTVSSFVVLAASGIVINLVVAVLRNAEALGVFNQAYSFYIIISQIAVFGIHYSVLRNAAIHEDEPDKLGQILVSAMVPAIVLGFVFAIAVFAMTPLIAIALDSPQTARATGYAALGMALFPLNKVLISFINGIREMKAFAILQGGRYIIVALVVTAVSSSELPFEYSLLCFVVAEAITVLAAIWFILAKKIPFKAKFNNSWMVKHLRFGSKGLVAGMFGEINTRVDVLMLGVFLPDSMVGIYSFAAMIFDGLYHLLAMVRVNFNPYLVSALSGGDKSAATKLLKKNRIFAPLVIGILSVGALAFYWVLTAHFISDKSLIIGLPSLAILIGALTLLAGYIPFDNLLLVGGFPGYQTLQQGIAVLTNVAGNLFFIPLLGIEGAAVGTVLSHVAGIIVLIIMSQKLFNWNMIKNRME